MAEYPALVIKELQMMQTDYYLLAAAGALVVYDQILRFSQEVNLVWNRHWSFITALYFIARYLGSLYVVANAALSMCINWTLPGFLNMFLVINWTETIFILTMQAILSIRVYALFNRSKKVLIFLSTFYVLQATAEFVMTGFIYDKRVIDRYYASIGPAVGSVAQPLVVNPSAAVSFVLTTLNQDATILSIVFDIILLLFALWAFVKHALEAKTLEGGWSINVLVRTLVADHLLYFICNLIWLLLPLAIDNSELAGNVNYLVLSHVYHVFSALVAISGPHMVISLRTTESKTRGEGGTFEGEISTIRFDAREPSTQVESVVEEGGGLRAVGEIVEID